MAIEIYIGRNNIPDDLLYVHDVEKAFYNVVMSGDPLQKMLLDRIEHAKYRDPEKFEDRFGGLLYYSLLSTGTKALLLAACFPDCVINLHEAGLNALACLPAITDCRVYLYPLQYQCIPWIGDASVYVNGVRYASIRDIDWERWHCD